MQILSTIRSLAGSQHRRALLLQLIVPLLSLPYGCSQQVKSARSSTGNLAFETIAYDAPDLNRPGAGVESWNGQNAINIPIEGIDSGRLDRYYRFVWSDLETGAGKYDWAKLDEQLDQAIDARQKFAFGVMPLCETCKTGVMAEGAQLSYPGYLHEQMMRETVKPFQFNENWTPNWNSDAYLSALERLNSAINAHLLAGSHRGIFYKDIINYIDIRGFGSYGEWHNYPYRDAQPTANKVNATSLMRIIDAYKNGFPDFQLVALIGGFDPKGWSDIPAEVSYYLLTSGNKAGLFGWRRDSFGNPARWFPAILEDNPGSSKGQRLSGLIMDRWKTAPIVGEPMPCCTADDGPCAYWQLETQVRRYHVCMFGNGNLETESSCAANNIRSAAKAAGYRLVLEGGKADSTFHAGDAFDISLYWRNLGVAPTYERWSVVYELHDLQTDSLLWAAPSYFSPTRLLPADSARTATDHYTLPKGLHAGNYDLQLVVRDPSGYREPLPLAIAGRRTNGSYSLRTIEIVAEKSR